MVMAHGGFVMGWLNYMSASVILILGFVIESAVVLCIARRGIARRGIARRGKDQKGQGLRAKATAKM